MHEKYHLLSKQPFFNDVDLYFYCGNSSCWLVICLIYVSTSHTKQLNCIKVENCNCEC